MYAVFKRSYSFLNSDNVETLDTPTVRILAGCCDSLNVVCDILITGGLCYYFRMEKLGLTRYVQYLQRALRRSYCDYLELG